MTASTPHGQREAEDGEPHGAERRPSHKGWVPARVARLRSRLRPDSSFTAGASTVGLAYARTRWP